MVSDGELYRNYRHKKIEIPENLDEVCSSDNFLDILFFYAIYKNIDLTAPVTVTWEFTKGCNADCIHCYAEAGSKGLDELSTEEAQNLVRQLADSKVIQITLGGGEPLLRDDFVDIIEEIKKRRLWLQILTNGTLVDEEIARVLSDLLDFRVDAIQVSLDGPTAEIHNRQRGAPLFDETIRAIQLLVKEDVPVTIKFVPTIYNYTYVKETYLLARELGASLFSATECSPIGRAASLARFPVEELFRSAVELIKLSSEEPPKYIDGLAVQMFNYRELREAYPRKYLDPDVRLTKCPAARGQIEISSNGVVYPCAFFHSPEYAAGNIRETHFSEIWENRKRVWSELYKGRSFKGTKCEKCGFLHICKGGCMGAAFNVYNTVNAPDPNCTYNPEEGT